jgi:hypothetical protein
MDKEITALIRWLTPLAGGRTAPPSGPTYSTVAHFKESADEWPAVAWSVVLEFLEPFKSKALVRFLMPNAPDHLLKIGADFDLYEGPNLVAHAEVIEGE